METTVFSLSDLFNKLCTLDWLFIYSTFKSNVAMAEVKTGIKLHE